MHKVKLLCGRDTFFSYLREYGESLIKFRLIVPVKFICVLRGKCAGMLFQRDLANFVELSAEIGVRVRLIDSFPFLVRYDSADAVFFFQVTWL